MYCQTNENVVQNKKRDNNKNKRKSERSEISAHKSKNNWKWKWERDSKQQQWSTVRKNLNGCRGKMWCRIQQFLCAFIRHLRLHRTNTIRTSATTTTISNSINFQTTICTSTHLRKKIKSNRCDAGKSVWNCYLLTYWRSTSMPMHKVYCQCLCTGIKINNVFKMNLYINIYEVDLVFVHFKLFFFFFFRFFSFL